MCGLTGFIDLKLQLSSQEAQTIITNMTRSLDHRGPDAHGIWHDDPKGLYLGHTRLSIQDLTQHGHQPMHSSCGRYILVYNGEIYNHLELRKELKRPFSGHSDTETLVEALAEWGIVKTLPRLNGMFAFALWDRELEKLTLVRDRLGIKPLYWGLTDKAFYFASELKPFKHCPLFQTKLNQQAIYEFLHYSYIPAPLSIYQDTFKLKPGYFLEYQIGHEPELTCYWDIEDKARWGIANLLPEEDPQAAIQQLEDLIRDAVSKRFISDVPLGAFLSGGIDSSTVVAFMQELSQDKIKTFTIGFEDKGYDESSHAKQVANHLGTDHTELILKPNQVLDVIPNLPNIYDEPFADSSQLPTYLVSQLARQSVTVALSGDGGDENFAGYNRHMFAQSGSYKALSKLPAVLRKSLAMLLKAPSPQTWDRLSKMIPVSKRPRQMGDKLAKLAGTMSHANELEVYQELISCFKRPEDFLLNPVKPEKESKDFNMDFMEFMQLRDMMGYLPDDILTKVDRASMAVSLEARVPLLDYRIVEFSWRLPRAFKIRNNTSKWILREILYKRVPKSLIERPKMGFALPIDQWLRGPLQEWAYDLLSADKVGDLFDKGKITSLLDIHMSGKENLQNQIWSLAILQQWRG